WPPLQGGADRQHERHEERDTQVIGGLAVLGSGRAAAQQEVEQAVVLHGDGSGPGIESSMKITTSRASAVGEYLSELARVIAASDPPPGLRRRCARRRGSRWCRRIRSCSTSLY